MPFLAHLSSFTFKYNDFTMAAIPNCNLGNLEGAHVEKKGVHQAKETCCTFKS